MYACCTLGVAPLVAARRTYILSAVVLADPSCLAPIVYPCVFTDGGADRLVYPKRYNLVGCATTRVLWMSMFTQLKDTSETSARDFGGIR